MTSVATIDIRKARKKDCPEVKELIHTIMSSEFSEELAAYPLQDVDNVCASYGTLGDAFFVAIDNGTIVGTVGIKREDDRTAFLRRIFVLPSHRRRHIGSKLLDRAITFCREVGYQEIVFKTTSRMKSAILLCQNKGFVERARIDLGGMELFKYTLFLKENSPLMG